MGLFDRFKKKESVPSPAPEPVQEKPQQPEWLREEALMEGIPVYLSEAEAEDLERRTSAVFGYKDEEPERAFSRLQYLAELGCGEAMYWTALCYEDGDGVEENREEYLRWLWRAAYSGHADAMYALGVELEQPKEPLKKDLVEAFRWYTKAAAKGSETAKEELEEYVDAIREDRFYIYEGTAREAMKIIDIYKAWL